MALLGHLVMGSSKFELWQHCRNSSHNCFPIQLHIGSTAKVVGSSHSSQRCCFQIDGAMSVCDLTDHYIESLGLALEIIISMLNNY